MNGPILANDYDNLANWGIVNYDAQEFVTGKPSEYYKSKYGQDMYLKGYNPDGNLKYGDISGNQPKHNNSTNDILCPQYNTDTIDISNKKQKRTKALKIVALTV